MAASFQAKQSNILNQQLKVQELCVRFADVGLYTVATNVLSIDIGENVDSITLALFKDNSAATCLPVVAANASIVTSTVITLDLGAVFAANDVVLIKYIVAE